MCLDTPLSIVQIVRAFRNAGTSAGVLRNPVQ